MKYITQPSPLPPPPPFFVDPFPLTGVKKVLRYLLKYLSGQYPVYLGDDVRLHRGSDASAGTEAVRVQLQSTVQLGAYMKYRDRESHQRKGRHIVSSQSRCLEFSQSGLLEMTGGKLFLALPFSMLSNTNIIPKEKGSWFSLKVVHVRQVVNALCIYDS